MCAGEPAGVGVESEGGGCCPADSPLRVVYMPLRFLWAGAMLSTGPAPAVDWDGCGEWTAVIRLKNGQFGAVRSLIAFRVNWCTFQVELFPTDQAQLAL